MLQVVASSTVVHGACTCEMTADDFKCDRTAAVYGLGASAEGHHNFQLPLFGLSLMLVGGRAIQHFFSDIPLPYTVMLLLFGVALGCWVLFDPAFTLRPGTMAGAYEWDGHVLQCNVSQPIANDLHCHGWHLGNSLRMFAEMDPHLMMLLLLPPLLFESAFAIDWHLFRKLSWYAVFLALPGLLVATTLTGLTYAALYGWGWEACMLLGASSPRRIQWPWWRCCARWASRRASPRSSKPSRCSTTARPWSSPRY